MSPLPSLGPGAFVTQYGRRGRNGWVFWNHPKAGQDELSLLAGRYPVDTTTILIARRDVDPNDAVRYATVGCLEEAGFTLERTPNRRNPDHVSVKLDGLWDDAAGDRFDACFEKPVTEGMGRG